MSVNVLRRASLLVVITFVCYAAGRTTQASDGPYKFTDHILIGVPAVQHAFDATNGRLYSTAAGFPRGLFVVNMARPGIAERLGEAPFGPIDVAPDLNEVFVLSLTERFVRVVDMASKKVVKTFEAPTGNAVFYEASRQELYVLGTDNRTLTVLSARTGTPMGSLTLVGDPSFIVADPSTNHIYVRLVNHDAVQVIDPVEHAIVATWKVEGYRASSLAVDPIQHRLFVSSANNIFVLDTRTGATLGKIDLQHFVLGLAFDASRQMLMASTPIGLAVARAGLPVPTLVQTVSEQIPQSALFLNPKTHEVFAVGGADLLMFEPR